MIKPVDLYAMMQKGEAPVIVDVRLAEEWMGLRIGTVINLPLSHLAELSSKLDPSQPGRVPLQALLLLMDPMRSIHTVAKKRPEQKLATS